MSWTPPSKGSEVHMMGSSGLLPSSLPTAAPSLIPPLIRSLLHAPRLLSPDFSKPTTVRQNSIHSLTWSRGLLVPPGCAPPSQVAYLENMANSEEITDKMKPSRSLLGEWLLCRYTLVGRCNVVFRLCLLCFPHTKSASQGFTHTLPLLACQLSLHPVCSRSFCLSSFLPFLGTKSR